jgi:hypothetical protein
MEYSNVNVKIEIFLFGFALPRHALGPKHLYLQTPLQPISAVNVTK